MRLLANGRGTPAPPLDRRLLLSLNQCYSRRLRPSYWGWIRAAEAAGEAGGVEAAATAARRQGWAVEVAEASAVRTVARETAAASHQRCTCPRLRRRHR